jgi:hypothetical protein
VGAALRSFQDCCCGSSAAASPGLGCLAVRGRDGRGVDAAGAAAGLGPGRGAAGAAARGAAATVAATRGGEAALATLRRASFFCLSARCLRRILRFFSLALVILSNLCRGIQDRQDICPDQPFPAANISLWTGRIIAQPRTSDALPIPPDSVIWP